jgi:hypothetical protein
VDKEHLSAEARAIRDRLFGWDSPTQAQLEEIGTIEYLWGRLLDTILERCPDNRERDQAIVHLESVREWTRKSIIRGEESRDR